ncbi:MAG: helicase HerA-like domain-containing protein [Thermodesulfobacteriota bacterium]
MTDPIPAAKGEHDLFILPAMANRHGLISGATGTGKTVTLQVLSENFSMMGVPVFVADVKGDLSGLSRPGSENPKIIERINRIGLSNFKFGESPVVFWDVFGAQGHPVRTTVSEMGPLLLSRLLNLNDTQTGVLTLVFEIADDNGLLLLDLKDLRSMLRHVGDNSSSFTTGYGNISGASIGAIQRNLITLENEGGDVFFGEPALDLDDFLRTDPAGRGVINILAADGLIRSPVIYATLLLWLLSELFEQLPEAGDPEKPKFVFFFDEAHLLFDNAPKALLDKVEQVARLIRSKGVGVYFVTQSPLDIPDIILGQLGNKVQHALRAYTPRDQKSVRAAAETFRTNPALDAGKILMELGVGEALVSFLDNEGRPNIVERAIIRPPFSRIGPVTPEERGAVIQNSPLRGVYEKVVDRESAYEMLKDRAVSAHAAKPAPKRKPVRRSDTPIEAMAKSAARSVGRQIATELVRGILGSFLGGRRR